jgi:carbamoyl-phosphate synthase large subunit
MTVSQRNVLVVPAGTAIGLEVGASLAKSKHWRVHAANSVRDHSEMVFHRVTFDIPYADHPRFVDAVAQLATEIAADFVVPAHDDAIAALSGHTLGPAVFVGPPKKLADVLRSKSKTYERLKGIVAIPEIYDPTRIQSQALPIFVKPDRGQGSRGARLISSFAELLAISSGSEDMLYLEYLPGAEFTIDCYSNSRGQLIYCAARARSRISNGIAVRTEEAVNAWFENTATRIAGELKMQGAWFFQVKEAADGQLKLLEVANRVSGTMGFQRERGINLIEAWLHELSGREVRFLPWNFGNLVLDRSLEARVKWDYKPERVYVDLDDTVILPDGQLNYRLVGILFGLKYNAGIQMVLITRHRHNVEKTLHAAGLAQLFDKIVHLTEGQPKSEAITVGEPAIFVDDSFGERMEVSLKHNIPTFPVEAMACLESLAQLSGHASFGFRHEL